MLELNHIQKAFDGVPVLKDISLQVEDGEIVSILGPSGCGKTTLLNLILGIVEADGGQILYNGEDLTHTAMEKRGWYTPQTAETKKQQQACKQFAQAEKQL